MFPETVLCNFCEWWKEHYGLHFETEVKRLILAKLLSPDCGFCLINKTALVEYDGNVWLSLFGNGTNIRIIKSLITIMKSLSVPSEASGIYLLTTHLTSSTGSKLPFPFGSFPRDHLEAGIWWWKISRWIFRKPTSALCSWKVAFSDHYRVFCPRTQYWRRTCGSISSSPISLL